MQLKRLLCASAVALAAAAATPAAVAAPCGGFTDVDDTVVGAAFCQNVEWVKNRGVTLGCTLTQYCPNSVVNRLAMAAFLNRLGDTLTPLLVRKRQTGGQLGSLNYNTPKQVCVTDPVTPTTTATIPGWPRTAVITGLLNAFTPTNASFTLQAQIVYSTTGPTGPWLAVPAGDGFAFGALYPTVPGTGVLFSPPMDVSMRAHTTMDLDVPSTYHFAVQGVATAISGGTGQAVAQSYCELHAQIISRTGASSPFDPLLDGAPPGR